MKEGKGGCFLWNTVYNYSVHANLSQLLNVSSR